VSAGSLASPPQLSPLERFWRNRRFARVRHHLTWLRRSAPLLTRAHAVAIRLSGGRIRRSFLFTGGMPVLVLTTVGRKTGRSRSTPIGYLRHGEGFAVLASNAGSDRSPAWWLNLQAEPRAEILAERTRYAVTARQADAEEQEALWRTFASLNPGFDEYRRLTKRRIPVILLEPRRGSR
jgi:deazaflavin-dependent oxidoreductase (nitroreductase family)